MKALLGIIFIVFSLLISNAFADSNFILGEIKWSQPSYFLSDKAVVQLIDNQLNLDSQVAEIYYIDVWSDSDAGGLDLEAIETGTNTGIFEVSLFFTTSGKSDDLMKFLRVSDGDTLTTQFRYDNLPQTNPQQYDTKIVNSAKFVEKNVEKHSSFVFNIDVEQSKVQHGETMKIFGKADSRYSNTPVFIEVLTWDYVHVTNLQSIIEQDGSWEFLIDTSQPTWEYWVNYRVKAMLGNTGYVDNTDFELEPTTEQLSLLDLTKPVVIVPKPIFIDSNIPTVVEFIAKAVDDVDGILPVVCDPPSGSVFPVGRTEVVCRATDSSGNRGSSYIMVTVEDQSLNIPAWIKDVASFWINDEIDDDGFVQVIDYLIENKVIMVAMPEVIENPTTDIPSWIKTNAEFWVNSQIPDAEFATGIEWLIQNGIIRI